MSSQRKLISRKKLELLLQKIDSFIHPKPELEQYPISPRAASTILTIIANTYNDIQGKTIGDLGCGTGIFAIGAALLDAKQVTGVDIDQAQLDIAVKNAKMLGVNEKIQWLQMDIKDFSKPVDVVIQNPPFGVQKRDRGMDVVFLKTAIRNAEIIYSLHKSGEKIQSFLRNHIKNQNAMVNTIVPLQFSIPHLFNFHRKKQYPVEVDLYRIISNK